MLVSSWRRWGLSNLSQIEESKCQYHSSDSDNFDSIWELNSSLFSIKEEQGYIAKVSINLEASESDLEVKVSF